MNAEAFAGARRQQSSFAGAGGSLFLPGSPEAQQECAPRGPAAEANEARIGQAPSASASKRPAALLDLITIIVTQQFGRCNGSFATISHGYSR
jgi:hypothetical protein